MPLPIPDRDASLAAVQDSAARIASLLRETNDPDARAIGHWSVSQTAAHLSHIYGVVPRLAQGQKSPVSDHRKMAGTWERLLLEDPERNLQVLADRIEDSSELFLQLATQGRWTEDVIWHGGIEAPLYSLASILINEAEVHGYDIAGAERRDWTISTEHARLSLKGIYPLMPHFIDAEKAEGFSANFSIDLRDKAPTYMSINHGTMLVSQERPHRIDCHISADPVNYLLIGYGRISQIKPILTGKVFAYGKKPWLGMRFTKLLYRF